MKKLFIYSLFLNHFLIASDIARVLNVENQVYLTRDNSVMPVTNQTLFQKNDIINTSNQSSLKLLFIDGTTVKFDSNSSLRISNYEYDNNSIVNFMIPNGEFELKVGTISSNNFRIHTENSIFIAKCMNMKIKISENIENIECIYADEIDEDLEFETIKNPLDSNIENLSEKTFFN